MIWSGIILHHKTDLVCIEETMNQLQYINQVLQPVVQPFSYAAGSDLLCMHDNARPHTALQIRDWFQEENIAVLPWPPQAPDLNPIEHVWDMLQRSLTPLMAGIQGRRAFEIALQEQWALLPQAAIDKCILSMPRRCRAVINSRDGNTQY